MNITDILDKYKADIFVNEDGEESVIGFADPCSLREIELFEKNNKIQLPDELKEFYLYSNGFDLFEHTITDLQELEYDEVAEMLIFHDWGNGDFDSVSTGKNNYGKVYFLEHSIDSPILVEKTFSGWISKVLEEVKVNGTLFHPMDYEDDESRVGLYKKVYKKLSN